MKKKILLVLYGLLLTCYTINSNAQNTKFGTGALANNTTGTANSAFGFNSLNANKIGSYNTATGYLSLSVNNANGNTATGFVALRYNTSGANNTAYGANALQSNTEGQHNTACGLSALYSNLTGNLNTATGANALFSNKQGVANTASGFNAIYSNTQGDGNTASGYASMYNTEGVGNTAIGFAALYANTSGYQNTALGYLADVTTGNLSNATAIGNGARVNRSDAVAIGNGSVVSIGGVVNWTNYSDGRYKTNIKENIQGLSFINSLRPITYTINVKGLNEYYNKGRNQPEEKVDENLKAIMDKSTADASKIVYNGFIAQEVEVAAKKLNYEFSGVDKPQNKEGIYGLRYGDFVVPLVKAVQELSGQNEKLKSQNDEQQKINDAQQQKIQKLEQIVQSLQQSFEKCNPCEQQSAISSQQSENKKTISLSSASLEQNIPNPFNNTTTISYTLPQQYSSAKIIITAQNGKVLKEVNVSGSGKGSVHIDASTLANGAYHYSLYVEGKLIDSKQMVLAK